MQQSTADVCMTLCRRRRGVHKHNGLCSGKRQFHAARLLQRVCNLPGEHHDYSNPEPCRRLCRVRTVGFSTLTRRMHRDQPSGLVRHAASEGLSMHDKAGCHLHRQCGQTQGNAIAILRLAEHASTVCFCCVTVETKSFVSHACKAGRAKSGQCVLIMQARQTGE